MENEKKEIFYVFTSINHTLMGEDFLDYYYGELGMTYGYLRPDRHSMKALNSLLENLEKKYDTKLVIASKRNERPTETDKYLRKYGLNYDKPIFFAPVGAGERGDRIVSYLESLEVSPLEYHKLPLYAKLFKYFKDNPDFKNYVVLDQGNLSMLKYIPQSQFVAVNRRKGLTMKDAEKIAKTHGIEFTLPESEQKAEMPQK